MAQNAELRQLTQKASPSFNEWTQSLTKGTLLGKGQFKNAYSVYGEPKLALLQMRDILEFSTPAKIRGLNFELALLLLLKNAGVRVPIFNPALIKVDGTPSILIEKFSYSSRTDPFEFLESINSQSLEDIEEIESALTRAEYEVNDLQMLINNKGRVVIADPLGVRTKQANNSVVMHLKQVTKSTQPRWLMFLKGKRPSRNKLLKHYVRKRLR